MEHIWLEIGLAIVGLIFSVIGFLIKDKLSKNAKEITLLFELHTKDSEALTTLQREIDRDHYMKHELDAKFLQLDTTMKEGLRGLGDQIKELSRVLTDHFIRENGNGNGNGK